MFPSLEGDLEISCERTVTQKVTGTITVHPGGCLILLGVAERGVVVRRGGFAHIAGTTKGLVVAAGGYAVLTGTCLGSATNDGGELTIKGTVTGELLEGPGAPSYGPVPH